MINIFAMLPGSKSGRLNLRNDRRHVPAHTGIDKCQFRSAVEQIDVAIQRVRETEAVVAAAHQMDGIRELHVSAPPL